MCGIVGFNSKKSETLKSMLKSIHHRGPDDNGEFEDDDISLGHVRLSILDLSSHGHQPMTHENLEMVFNGEVYNFMEIREELEKDGYTFVSDSDSEVVLKSFHKWGKEAVEKFVGMFAFSIYDKAKRELYIFRDRVGVKPLYYYHKGDDFAFASELRALKEYNKDLSVNKDALNEYMQFSYISNTRSIYNDVFRLLPGHYLTYNLDTKKITTTEYWSILPFFEKPKFDKSEEQILDELEEILIKACKYRMVADVPVGVFLSGGTDSSVVAAILQKHYGNIKTFTIGFKEAKYNEATYAKELAKYIGTEHTEQFLGADEAGEILKEFVEIYDEPFGDSSGIPTTLVCQVAREHGAKVVLSADGGDEVFCGYERYWHTNGLSQKMFKIPYFLRASASSMLSKIDPKFLVKVTGKKNIEHKFSQTLELLKSKDHKAFYEKMMQNTKNHELREIMGEPIEIEDSGYSVGDREHDMQGMMLYDYHRFMVDDVLVKVDRATMYNSIEGREPLLDHTIAEYMAQVPFELKYKDGTSKYLLKKILERYVPREFIDRPKMGFGIPMFEWFSTDLKDMLDKYLTKENIEKQGFFNYEAIEKEMTKMKNEEYVNIDMLWYILVFQMWHERYME
jgi:asparagine synthase (glutamine-hydrolysing)